MSEFLSMGGYAIYVWPCALLSALVFLGIAWRALRSEQELLAQLRRRAAARAEVQR